MINRLIAASAILLSVGSASAKPVPSAFASMGKDRVAIEALLATYTSAVSSKNQPLFETLLLSKDIPFSGVGLSIPTGASAKSMAGYDGFRQGVFEGRPFTQRFYDVHIRQDGALANVSLVFVNSGADGQSWGWKTLQLLKVGDRWKIASEFYTGHAGRVPAAAGS